MRRSVLPTPPSPQTPLPGVAPTPESELDRIAAETGASRRRPRKFSCADLMRALVAVASGSRCCLSEVALRLSTAIGGTVSRQAVHARLDKFFVLFLCRAMGERIGRLHDRVGRPAAGIFSHFGRVLLQDSTCVALPPALAARFPGASNQTGKTQAGMKVQTVFDLKSDLYQSVGIDCFRRNDQAASPDILAMLRPFDLVLRDLGYFVLPVFAEIAARGAYFLSRLRSGTVLIDPATGARLELHGLLKGVDWLDISVLLGAGERLPARVVACRVPPDVAAERRRKANANRDRRSRPNAEKLALLDWEIFVTNVPAMVWAAETVCIVYAFRWRIEILFKTWKSFLRLTSLPQNVSAVQAECLALARIYHACEFHATVWQVARHTLSTRGRHASILRTIAVFHGPSQHELLALASTNPEAFREIVAKHCAYDRRKRLPFEAIFDLCATGPGSAPAGLPIGGAQCHGHATRAIA